MINKVDVKGICHITGGGFYENIPRILQENMNAEIHTNSWEVPPILKLIQQKGNITDKEMFSTFNMGIGMMVIVKEKDVGQAIQILRDSGENVKTIGKIVSGSKQVIL